MILKSFLIIITLLCRSILTTVTAYSEYDDGRSNIQAQHTQVSAADIALSNQEIYGPPIIQQQVKASEKRTNSFNNMDMNMDSKTEVSLRNILNISDNQLSNEYTFIEHVDHSDDDMAEEREEYDNLYKQSMEQNIKLLRKEDEYATENPLSKNVRMGRIFTTTTTTTVPQYINKLNDNKSTKYINISNFDYIEDDAMLRKHTITTPLNRNIDISSEENDDIEPLAMKYYDDVFSENTSASRQVEEVSSENYYEGEYHNQVPKMKTTTTTTTTATTTTTQAPDNGILHKLFAGFTTTTAKVTIKPIITPTLNPLMTTLSSNNPTIGQFDSSQFTTSSPLPPQIQAQTQIMTDITTTSRNAAATSTTNDKKAKQIPIISTVPVITTTTTTTNRRRLLPHEQLRNYIEDAYIRMPLAVIVDPAAGSLEKTKTLWNDAIRTNLNIKIVLVTLNEADETPAAFNFNNTRQFLTSLNSIKEQHSGDTFRGISHAAELVPYDSAVFISTAQLAKHTDQVQESAITLLKKRIRLYLIWFGERSLSENETQDSVGGILGEVAIRSGGEILHLADNENSQELEGSTLTIVADALRDSQEVDVPVDTTLSSLHVKIDKLMRRAVLETPNGEINLKKLVKFKKHPLTTFNNDDKHLDAYIPLTKLRKATIYKLKVIPEDLTTEYSVFIRGERKADTFLDDMIKHFETNLFKGHTPYPANSRNGKLERLTFSANVNPVKTHSNIEFPSDEILQPKSEVEIFSTNEIHQNIVSPHRNNSSSLTATTAESQQRNTNILLRSNTKIEIGTESQVLIVPGMIGHLYFEITNTGHEAIYYTIQVVDERRYLMRLTPQSLFLRAGQMSTVTVTVLVPQNTAGGTVDHIIFSATGAGITTSISLNLKVTTNIDAQDNTSPSISWFFGSRCEGVSRDFNSCSERFWNMYITAQDWQTGIMRLKSTPSSGLIYTKPYTIGTTEPLKATYVASCCDPKVSLTAYDVAGNQRSYNIDVRDLVLTEASIAAIILGVILLTLFIIMIIVAIVWCCRKRKVVLDLPTYRSHSARNME